MYTCCACTRENLTSALKCKTCRHRACGTCVWYGDWPFAGIQLQRPPDLNFSSSALVLEAAGQAPDDGQEGAQRYRVVNASVGDEERWARERREEEEGRRWELEGWVKEEEARRGRAWRGEFDWVGMLERERERERVRMARAECEKRELEGEVRLAEYEVKTRAERREARRMLRTLKRRRWRCKRRQRRTVRFRHGSERRQAGGRAVCEHIGERAPQQGGGKGGRARAIVTEVILLEDDLETEIARAEWWLATQGACM